MGIKNVKLKKDLLQGIEKYKKIELEALRPSKSACKELFTLVLN
jgi:septum formation topological specificity factor MinE